MVLFVNGTLFTSNTFTGVSDPDKGTFDGVFDCSAERSSSNTRPRAVVSPTPVTVTSNNPVRLIDPANSRIPGPTSSASDSPVIED